MSKLKKSRRKEIREGVRRLVASHIEARSEDLVEDAAATFITGDDEAQYVREYLITLAESIRPKSESETINEDAPDGRE